MEIGARPLPQAEQIIEATGLKMTYPFDDLVFVEHNPFLLRFNDKNSKEIYIHFNVDCEESKKHELIRDMEVKACKIGMVATVDTNYALEQLDGSEEIQIKFS